jgi:GGDEF domain-containing protein
MIVHRLMTVVVRSGVADLQAQAFTDSVTGLGNERAYGLDLRREQARAARHDRPLTVVRLAVPMAEVGTGEALRAMGQALRSVSGDEVHPYRVGFGQFALLLPNAVPVDPGFVVGPLAGAGITELSIGLATHPADPVGDLDELAERRRAPVRVPS